MSCASGRSTSTHLLTHTLSLFFSLTLLLCSLALGRHSAKKATGPSFCLPFPSLAAKKIEPTRNLKTSLLSPPPPPKALTSSSPSSILPHFPPPVAQLAPSPPGSFSRCAVPTAPITEIDLRFSTTSSLGISCDESVPPLSHHPVVLVKQLETLLPLHCGLVRPPRGSRSISHQLACSYCDLSRNCAVLWSLPAPSVSSGKPFRSLHASGSPNLQRFSTTRP
ncbi:hypothetical protein BKA61DRAFT_263942 [Leptodontidium sp. MPI-SDFR-AT-0119]|nr:hypothetical protein BKA61DRAFT_263942 [Leptodontidium sp. MPI-SDFR-AT-0119]